MPREIATCSPFFEGTLPEELPVVTYNSQDPIHGPKQKAAYLEKYLPAILAGSLTLPRRNMKLDTAVENVVDNCIRCCPKDPEERFVLALRITEGSPYQYAISEALRQIDNQYGVMLSQDWTKRLEQFCPFLVGKPERLLTSFDASANPEIREKAFALAAKIASGLVRYSPALPPPDHLPLFVQSLSNEEGQDCYNQKFMAVCAYLKAADNPSRGIQEKEEQKLRLATEAQNRINMLAPLEAIQFIFSVFQHYNFDCVDGFIFKRAPFDLVTLKQLCYQGGPEQIMAARRQIKIQFNLLFGRRSSSSDETTGSTFALEALIDSVFPPVHSLRSQ